jgi:hypothetical protein
MSARTVAPSVAFVRAARAAGGARARELSAEAITEKTQFAAGYISAVSVCEEYSL